MRRLLLLTLAACGGADSDHPKAAAQKPPNDTLILGSYERRPPLGTTAIRFERDGNVTLAHDKSKLDSETLAKGTWALDKDQLTLTYTEGDCAQDGPGVYKIVVSRLGVHFQLVNDACETRQKMDGQVWRRIE
jgi:hypothetical protein